MNRVAQLVLCCVVLFAVEGCKKPSPASVAAEAFVTAFAHSGGRPELPSGVESTRQMTGGEPTMGQIEIYTESVGALDWVRTKVTRDEKTRDGAYRVDVVADVCMRAEMGGGCSRPNTYLFRMLMTQESGAWTVAGASCELTNQVR